MKLDILLEQDEASAYGAAIFIICLIITSCLILLINEFADIFFDIMLTGYVKDFMILIWPNGVLLGIFLACAIALLMHYQKRRYEEIG